VYQNDGKKQGLKYQEQAVLIETLVFVLPEI